ncbi:hypothetical protein OZX65_06000 [Leuconostocaceae bacterium ESL0723]|nr:hypothetical protein OZX65_06000 [Leuconostocaceae bacterium ESL0723]
MDKEVSSEPGHHSYMLEGQQVTQEEFSQFKETHRFPTRLEKNFSSWADKQSSKNISPEAIEERWWRLEDKVEKMIWNFSSEVGERKGITVDFNLNVKGYVVRTADSENDLEQVFDQEIRKRVLDFLKLDPNAKWLIVETDDEGVPMVVKASSVRASKKYF